MPCPLPLDIFSLTSHICWGHHNEASVYPTALVCAYNKLGIKKKFKKWVNRTEEDLRLLKSVRAVTAEQARFLVILAGKGIRDGWGQREGAYGAPHSNTRKGSALH